MIPPDEKLERPTVPSLDSVLGQKFPVLDDGFVRVVDYMGSDESIVQAARVSYGRGTKRVHEDKGLIRYLIRNWHTTPLEMCEIKLHVRVPMDCWRQWIRHRTASVNEYSTRYSVAIDSAQKTKEAEWRSQSTANRQGSGTFLPETAGQSLSRNEQAFHQQARQLYEDRIALGVAREQARKDLPLSTYTEAYWKIDLHNLLHFLKLRLDPHAQVEIRQYAQTIADEVVKRWCPLTWEAFVDYRLEAVVFSRAELSILRAAQVSRQNAIAVALKEGFDPLGDSGKTNRERSEFEQKLEELNMMPPWKDNPSESD